MKRVRLFVGAAAALLMILSLPSAGMAQLGKAELSGTVRDPSGLPVPGAHLKAEDQATSVQYPAVSDERGEYHLLGLPAGQYVLTVEQANFRRYQQSGIVLRLADHVGLDVQIQIGAQSESVEVHAEAPLLQTASAEVNYHTDQTKLESLPLDGRNFVTLVALAPGVALPGGGSVLPRINGSRPRTNEYLYDGISVLQPEPGQVAFFPIIDGIEEFRLNINSYSPEYGRSNGGTIMVNGKSGGNQLHGTLFEFFRNDALNAKNLFASPGPRPEYRRNQYGFAVGGPIQKDKTFFFADWQGTRLRTAVPRLSTVPTANQKAGIFTSPVTDPNTGQSFTTIPSNLMDPVGVAVLKHYPDPNLPGTANNFTRTGVEPDNQDQWDARIDHNFGANHRVFARYTYARDNDTPVTPLPDGSGAISSGVTGHSIIRADSIVGNWDATLWPNTLNQLHFGYTRRNQKQDSLQNGDITVPGLPANSFPSVLPIFSVTGFAQIGPTTAANTRFSTSVTEYLDTFSMVRGRHTIKFGTDLRREALDVLNPPNPTGSFSFNTSGTGNSIASLLLGQVNAFSIDIQKETLEERAHIAEFFVGDEWKVSDRLSLNLGTRYTLNFPSYETHDRGAVFNLQTQVLDFPHTGRDLDCCDFGPRAGLAYRVGKDFVVRSGYGMIWFEQSGITTPFTLPQFPFIQTIGQQSQDNIHAAFPLSSGPTVQVTPPNPNSGLGQGVFGTDRTHNSGYSQQWNVTLQKTIGQSWNVEAGYIGSKNTNLGVPDPNINQLPDKYLSMGSALLNKVTNPFVGVIPASSSLGGATITAQQLLRPFPMYTNVALFRDNIGNSIYHALQAKIEKRFAGGLTFTAAYTYSKLIDDASSVFSQTIFFTGPVVNTGFADANNLHLDRDYSQGDIPQVFSAGWVYQIPKVWKISGWQISGLVRAQSGDRVAVTQGTNSNSNLGFVTQRPNRLSDPNDFAGRSVGEWFDTSAFGLAPQFTIGNSSRNPVRGPALQDADLMLGKTFALTERVKVEFRAEVFNITNTPPLNDPNGTTLAFDASGKVVANSFGSISSAGTPRDFEFAAKLHF